MNSTVKRILAAGAAVLAIGATGCGTVGDSLNSTPNAGPCPVAAVMYDASRQVEIKGEEIYSNVGFTGEITGVDGFCRYTGDNPITMEIDIDFALGRGPKADGNERTYEYFVAVTRRNRAVINKETFSFTTRFPGGSDRTTHSERLEGIVIPRANETISGSNFEVLVGFVLSEEELAFNRQGKRFRVTAGQSN